MTDPRLRTIVAAFASGQCPQAQMADYLEDVLGDARAEVVRKDRVTDGDLETATMMAFRAVIDISDKQRSLLRRRILARFPEYHGGICPGQLLSDLPGIGVCVWEDGENPIGIAVTTPDKEGRFEMTQTTMVQGSTITTMGVTPCRIGYHVPKLVHNLTLQELDVVDYDQITEMVWEWKSALEVNQ